MALKIQIAERLKPFCHLAGSSCILPGSTYQLQIFPTCFKVFDCAYTPTRLQWEIHLEVTGPVIGFTVQNDLEKGEVRVWGETKLGFLRYRLNACQKGQNIRLLVDKAPQGILKIVHQNEEHAIKPQENYFLNASIGENDQVIFKLPEMERLSLGNHKSQDWELIQRRQDLTEIFPVWHRLGQLINRTTPTKNNAVGTLKLLQNCQESVIENCPEKLVPLWTNLFLVGFKSLLVPQLQDNLHQGILPNEPIISDEVSALNLLTEGSRAIRELFLTWQDTKLHLLPSLPPEFYCGRLINVQVNGGIFSLEWSKKRVRRCDFKVNSDQDTQLQLVFKHARRCRMRRGGADKGQWICSGQQLNLEKNYHYFFDNFS